MERPVPNRVEVEVKMFWRWFQSDRQAIEAALKETTNGYDVSPVILTQAPANTEAVLEQPACDADIHDHKEYCFILPSSKKA